MQLRLLAITVFWCFMQFASSTEYSISAEYITMQEGLSDNNVNAILKDKDGFIWFGTSDGLNRYDGFTIKSYYPAKGSPHVINLYQCPEGYILIGTPTGLHIFNPFTETFEAHLRLYPNSQDSDTTTSVDGISGSISEGLLLATSSGIAILSFPDFINNKNNFNVIWKNKNNTEELTHSVFTCITKVPDGSYWLGTNTNIIVSYNPKDKHFHSHTLKYSTYGQTQFNITNIKFIEDNLVISSIGQGIHIMNPSTGKTLCIAHNSQNNSIISHKDVYGVVKDTNGDYWVATWDGLDQLNELNNQTNVKHYNWDQPVFKDKLENRMISILADPSGVLWIGTHGGGAVKINLEKQFFRRIPFNSLYEVKDFTTDNNNNLYISLYHGGIKKTKLPLTSTKTPLFEYFSTKGKLNRHIPTDIVLSSATDENGNIWFGTIESSLLFYNTTKDAIHEIKVKPENQKQWHGRIEALLIDSQGRFWLGTSNGLILYDRTSNKFHLSWTNPKIKHTLSGNYIRTILEDKQGHIWLGTNKGLNKLIFHHDKTFRFNQFNDLHTSSNILDNKDIWALHQMPDGSIWIGYRSALGYYDSTHSTIHFLNKRDGLCHNFVTCMTHQDDRYLWIGTNSGISRLNTQTLKFTNYYLANNLRAVFKTNDGNLIFGNNKGLLHFHPDSIKKRSFLAPTYITGIQIQNSEVNINEMINNRVLLKQAAPYTSSIDLHHPINSLAINYNGLSYLHQRANKYEYRLINFQDEWIRVDGSQRTATYNNLKPGKYQFEVRTANNDGIWNIETANLEINIYPAWYNSWWGRISIGLVMLIILFSFYRYRLTQLYRARDLELQGKELEHKLTIARIERDKEHELTEIKSRFFTNISHELRTPLTLIMAPVKELIKDTSLSRSVLSRLDTINQQTQHLYELISQILDLRKAETGQMKLNASANNIRDFITKVIAQFNPFARHKHIKLTFNTATEIETVWFDVEKMQTVLSNLLSNAIKFSPGQENITISLTQEAEKCVISVRDNGPGINKDEQERIFSRFYQSKNQISNEYTGSGIGLSLAQELVQLHHGAITVKSSAQQGSEFIISLPLGDQHLKDDEKGETHLREQSFLSTERVTPPANANKSLVPDAKLPKLLIVEDHEQLRQYLNSLLNDRFSILNAANGKEALDLLNKEIPNLIISDIMMPVMDGYELCKTLKTQQDLCHIPVILLTAKSSDKDILDGLETGADDYITKPFTPEILIAKTDNLVKSRELLKKYYSQNVTLASTNVEIEPHQEQFIRQAMEIIKQNLSNAQFNATVLAESLNMSQPTLYRRIKTFTGDNIATFIRTVRIKHAALLLKSGNYSVGETAVKAGFNDVAYFRKCFTRQFGVTPSKYK